MLRHAGLYDFCTSWVLWVFVRPCDSCVFVQVLGSGCAESQQEGLNKDLTVGPVRFLLMF